MPIISNFPGGSGSGQLKISSISVTTPPAKTTYKSGETFDPTGMVVTADYGYGLTAPVTGYEVTPNVLTDGITAVTISYTENRVTKTTTQAVTVTPVLSSVAVTTNPTKTAYSYLESFAPAGMVVTATMTDGSTKAVTGYTYPTTAFSTLGSQSVAISYTEDGVTKSTSLTVTVNAIQVAEPVQSNTPRYTGGSLSPEWTGYDTTKMSVSGDTSGVDAGTYTATFSTVYGYTFPGGTTANVSWTIGRQILPGIPAQSNVLIADGTVKTPTFSNYDPDKMDISGDMSGTAAGDYSAGFTPKSNYEWPDGTHGTTTVTWTITDVQVPIPTQANVPDYDGNPKTPEWDNADLEHSSVSVSAQVNAGDYTATWSLTAGVWTDDTTEDKIIPWSINKADPVVTAPTAKSISYTGEAQELVNAGITTGGTLQYSTDNTNWSTNIPTGVNAGSYTVYYRVVGNTNYNDGTGGSVQASISKAAGSVSASPSSVVLNSSATSVDVSVNRSGDGAITANVSSGDDVCTATVDGNVVRVAAKTTITKAASSFAVGDIVQLNENGTPVDYIVVHQGLPSSLYDASCNGTWLLRKDIAENRRWHSSSVNNYENSTINAYLNGDWLTRYDAATLANIKQVKIPYRSGGGSGGTDKSGANGLSCQIFLLSGYEVGFTTSVNSYFPVDGAKLDYFVSGNDRTAQAKRVANLNGSAANWWLRSPLVNDTSYVLGVFSDGSYYNYGATSSFGVRPALVLDSSALITGTSDPSSGAATVSINVAEGTNHTAASVDVPVEANFVNIYGVEWDGSSSTTWTRTDASAGFTDPNPAVSNGTGSSPFDNLYPWNGMVKEEDSAAGTLVKIPKFWYKYTLNGSTLKLQIADAAVDGFYVSPAHADRGDGTGERDYVYIGRYHSVRGYKSTTGAAQLVSITRSAARTGCHNLGTKIWQSDLAIIQTIQMLYLVEYADWDSQTKIGYGCSASGSKENNGKTDSMQYHTGTTAASRTTYGYTQYRWIEGLWDNVYDWMDGSYYNSSGLNVIMNPANFSDTANGTLIGMPSSGYPTVMTPAVVGGVQWLYPTTANGSNTTYVPDNWSFSASSPCLDRGGGYSQYLGRGFWYVDYNTASGAYTSVGCRLQKLP